VVDLADSILRCYPLNLSRRDVIKMSRKNGLHLSEEKEFQIFLENGFSADVSRRLSDLTVTMPFGELDKLFEAIKVIRRGER
jgi:hypothetical protein